MRELVVDNFAGGGGASTGIEMAIGRSVDIAINHDPVAIAMHKTNHPTTKHYIEDVWDVDPVEATQGQPVGLAWFSPACNHHSKARGDKPVDNEVRGLAWVVVKWALKVRPRVMMLENVEEFQTWGPLQMNSEGKLYPDISKRGITFRGFIGILSNGIKNESVLAECCDFLEIDLNSEEANLLRKGLGYKVEFRELRACDYGAPTTRKRLFLIVRCDGRKIVWPEPTHGDPEQLEVRMGMLQPWRTAAECIDWSIPNPSIFTRKKPLAENTLERIAKGFKKFIIDDPSPFIVEGEQGLIASYLATYYTETAKNEVRGQVLNKPLATIPTANRFGLVTAFISRQFKTSIGHRLDEPLATATTVNKSALVVAYLLKYYGGDIGQRLNEPLHTITTKDRFGLVTIKGEDYQIFDICFRMLQPHELYKGQGFPGNYIIDVDYTGRSYPKTAQTKNVGNSVSPPLPKALVEANVPELCEMDKKEVV